MAFAPLLSITSSVSRAALRTAAKVLFSPVGRFAFRRKLGKKIFGSNWDRAYREASLAATKAGAQHTARIMRRVSPVRTGRMRRSITVGRRRGSRGYTVRIPRRNFPDRYYPRYYLRWFWRQARRHDARTKQIMRRTYELEMRKRA